MTLTIHAFHIGTLKNIPVPALMYQRGFGDTHDVPMIMFAILGGEAPVIVDTGPKDPAFVKTWNGHTLDRPAHQEPAAALDAAGIDPHSVRTVILTHLHYDHASNNDLFPNARIVVQKSELAYAIDPLEPNLTVYNRRQGVLPPWLSTIDRVQTVVGDVAVEPGISVVHLPGHSPGSQGVLVQGDTGRFLLAGDCIDSYENWAGDASLSHIPSGAFTNLHDYMDSFAKIERLRCGVIPSHDFAVLDAGTFT